MVNEKRGQGNPRPLSCEATKTNDFYYLNYYNENISKYQIVFQVFFEELHKPNKYPSK